MCSSGGSPPQDYTNQRKSAEMMRWMNQDWQSRFQPIESGLLDELKNRDANTGKAVTEARATADKSFNATAGMAQRNLSRYGGQMDADQQAAMQRERSIQGGASKVAAGNMARDATTARYDQLGANAMALGRGVQGQAISGMQTAAGNEANRNIQNQQIAAQNSANNWNMLGTAAGIGGMAFLL